MKIYIYIIYIYIFIFIYIFILMYIYIYINIYAYIHYTWSILFVSHMSSKENIFISFHKKVWHYVYVTTALWQNQIIVIVDSIFLKCLNRVLCHVNGGFDPQQRLMSFEKDKKLILFVSCLPIVVVEQWLFTKIFIWRHKLSLIEAKNN